MDSKPILNFKKSMKDKRDKILLFSEPELPEIHDMRNDLMPCRDQGMQGSCYAQSAACMKEWQEKKNYGFNGYFSPQFFYCNRDNLYDNDFSNDEGMYGRDVMKVLLKIGICTEESCPYESVFNKNNIAQKVYEEAKNHTISGYASIRDMQTLKKSLIENGPALIGFPVYNYTDQMWIKRLGDENLGGHAMTIVGYNQEGFIIRNSWGPFWADNGYCIYKYQDWGVHYEIWATVDNLNSENIYVEKEEKESEESEENNDTEDSEENNDTEESEENNDTEESEENNDTEESEENNDNEESEEHNDTEESEENNDTEESEEYKDNEESEEYKDNEESEEYNDTEESEENNDVVDTEDNHKDNKKRKSRCEKLLNSLFNL